MPRVGELLFVDTQFRFKMGGNRIVSGEFLGHQCCRGGAKASSLIDIRQFSKLFVGKILQLLALAFNERGFTIALG